MTHFAQSTLNRNKVDVGYGVAKHRVSFRSSASVLGVFSLLGALACGARSPFFTQEPCYETGATRQCQNPCGAGAQYCQAGFWQPCEVAPIVQSCSNVCGSGTMTCAQGAWGDCTVAPTTRECSNQCGSGTQVCTDNAWQTCVVADTSRSCTNDCGDGTQSCSNNTWGDCKVAHQDEGCSSVCGTGHRTCDNNVWTACDAPQPLPPSLHAIVRDFRNGQPPDFGHPEITESNVDDRGFVSSILGADDTPTYVLSGPSLTVQSAQTFYEWYHDEPGPPPINMSTSIDLPLVAATDSPGLFTYVNHSFFPIDNQLFGNEGMAHNYSFTLVTAATFTYQGNETFSFTGDDDVFVYINRHLAIDLGGVHVAETETVDLASRAQEFEITPGNRYPIHIFFAERHPTGSDFVVETSIADIGACP